MQFSIKTVVSSTLATMCARLCSTATMLDCGVCCAMKLTVEKGERYLVWNIVLREVLEDPFVDVGVIEGL